MLAPSRRGLLAVAIGAAVLASGCGSCGSLQGRSRNAGPASRKVVDATGGTVTSSDGVLTVTVPPGALAGPVDLTIQPIVNTAPAGQGVAYELGPASQIFSVPVQLTFHNVTAQPSTALWLSFLVNSSGGGQGLWVRAGAVAVDGTANTLTVSVPDLGWVDWSLVTSGPNVGKDLVGSFQLVSTLEIPFTASTTQLTLAYAGVDARATYFLPVGPMTLQTPVALGAATCTPRVAGGETVQVANNAVVELRGAAETIPLLLAVDAHWDLACSDGTSALADTRFDTLGISLLTCARSYQGTPTLTAAKIQCDAANACSYVIDCGARGKETATFNLGACTPGVACTSASACHTAAISCTTGFPVCLDNGTVANGTGCGTDQVCGGGVCNACQVGQVCTSADACHTAGLVCSSGFPVCTDSGNQANGTSCGVNQVCSGGACASCTPGQACLPANPCHAGAVDCSTGIACLDLGTNLADGTSCGVSQVCGGGVCNACTAGQVCLSADACHTAAIQCGSGSPLCVDDGNAADGTGCGTGQVCTVGLCASCTAGAACVPSNPCHTGTQSCASGYLCVDSGLSLPPGTSCGTGQVCSAAGSCTPCVQGASCPPANPCHGAAIACGSGTPVCTDGANLADGTACGAGQSCNAGTCLASRTVAGTRLVIHWAGGAASAAQPAPELAAVPPAAPVAVSARVPDGAGGFVVYPGTFPSPGTFAIANVPVGAYLLDYVDAGGVHTLVETTASAVDLGYDLAGRNPLVLASGATPVTLTVSGLDPWSPAGDELQLTCAGAALWDVLATSPALAAGATGGDLVEDWFAGNASRAPLALLDASDGLLLHRLASATDAVSGQAYRQATSWTSLTGAALTDRTPATLVPPAFSAIPSLDGSLPAATWALSAFALLAQMNPTATTDGQAHTLVVGASPFALDALGAAEAPEPRLLTLSLAAGTADPGLGALSYGRFLPAPWSEWRGAEFAVHVAYTAPGATPLDQVAGVGRRDGLPPPAGPIVPAVTPVQAPLVNGASAFATTGGAGPSPTISWGAPATGSPSRYAVQVFWLHAVAGASAATPVASWVGTGLSLTIPPGILLAGNLYFARISAEAIAADPLAAATPAPLRRPAVRAWASALTGTFAP